MKEGTYDAIIQANDIRAAGTGSEFVYVLCLVDEEKIAAQIWLTPRARRMAKAQLRACGFDTASQSLNILRENHKYLEGNKVKIEVNEETYKGDTTLKARIVTSEVGKKRIEELDRMMQSTDEPGNEDDDIPF